MKQILLGINDNIYDVTKYVNKHPGEGICSVYLRQFNRKDCTSMFEKYHLTNEPDELLSNSTSKESLIKYVSPFFNFSKKKRIPLYYHYLPDDTDAIKFMEDKDNYNYILRPNINNIDNSVILTYKNTNIYHIEIKRMKDNKWYIKWNNIDIIKEYIEDVIKYILPENYNN